ncbi:MAG: protein-glutamate methylesterase/protein-glutamine glutaminase [Planctomycetota bacterium]|jgi:two-component system chemotaxis response regulator CheB
MTGPVKVLVVDDSAMVREILTRGLNLDSGIQVVGSAADPYIARDKIVQLKPDVLTLDVEMPKMDGVEFLRRLMPQYPLPVLMVSAMTEKGKRITLEALEAGALDFVTKPRADVARGLESMIEELCTKVKAVAKANVSHWKDGPPKTGRPEKASDHRALSESTAKVICIGGSTGGTEAVREVLSGFPPAVPGILVVLHMPPGFTKMYAERLNETLPLDVKEAVSGDFIHPGHVYIAPGNYHMKVKRSGAQYRVQCTEGEKVCGHRPSVQVMMESAAREVGANAMGIMLTGMGRDGADGMLAMRQAGARTLAQDEASCIVYGMPKETFAIGGAEKLVPLDRMSDEMLKILLDQNVMV